MIQVKKLVKTFEGFRALDGLDINVPEGAVYGLVGPNGAGKSTLIRHLAGIYRQDSGQVLIDGQPVYENPEIKGRIAYIPDDIFYYTQATINDMMKFYRSVYPCFSTERFEKLAELFNLDRKQPMRKLSKGMQKQAAFWLAMSQCPDVVILDEPVDGLDPVMRRQVWSALLSDVAENGTTVLVSSHNLRELEDVRPCGHHEPRPDDGGAELVRASGQHCEDPAGLCRRRQAARGAGDPAQLLHRPLAAADPAGQRGGAGCKDFRRRAAVSGCGPAESGGDLHLRAGRC